jgi:glutamate racemase
VQTIPGTELIARIEAGRLDDVEPVIRSYLDGPLAAGADQVVLGCTHYGLVREQVESVCAGRATVVDTATPVAAQAARVLAGRQLLREADSPGRLVLLATGETGRLVAAAKSLGLEADEARAASSSQPLPAGS